MDLRDGPKVEITGLSKLTELESQWEGRVLEWRRGWVVMAMVTRVQKEHVFGIC